MNFSETFKQTNGLCIFSPDGNYLASCTEFRLIVRDMKSLQIHRLYTCVDTIHKLEWSGDSQFILCCMFSRGVVQVWSMEEPEWTCKISEGQAGLADVMWGTDSRHIITTADFHLRLTIWSLCRKTVFYIKYPKKCKKGYDFSQDGRHMALAERRFGSDFISIFNCFTWDIERHFSVATDDLDGVEFSPNMESLAVWEDSVNYLVLIYSVLSGQCIGQYSAYDNALGIKTLQWSSTGQFLAVGSYDQKVRVLNNLTWTPVMTQLHGDSHTANQNVIVYKECITKNPDQPVNICDTGSLFNSSSKYVVQEKDVRFPSVMPDTCRANPKLGVGLLAFSPDCTFLYTRNDNMPCTLWIWDMKSLQLCTILAQAAPIKCVSWDPSQSRLALCTGTRHLFMWSNSGCLTVDIPVEGSFPVEKLTWHHSGKAILLQNNIQYCICFLHNQ